MIHVLSKILGRKKSGNNDGTPNGSTGCSPNSKSIWQKATSLRQSLRQSSRTKVGQKAGLEFSNISTGEKSATLGTPNSSNKPEDSELRREWRSQRNLARERRSLATKHTTGDDIVTTKRSLHSRSLCVSGDWDVDTGISSTMHDNHQQQQQENPSLRQSRSPRKLTKDSGYETSAQGDHDYANSLSDWFSEEKALDHIPDGRPWSKDNYVRNPGSNINGDNRLEWNARNRPLSFSHQEVASERAQTRQLRHSYSQREVSRQVSEDSLSNSSKEIKQLATSVESVNIWPNNSPITKSTPHLAQGRSQRLSTSSTGSLLQSELDEAGVKNMVTRRFKKGSVYDALASTSGLDFSPVVQLKTYNRRGDNSPVQGSTHTNPSNKLWETSAKFQRKNSTNNSDAVFYKEKSIHDHSDVSPSSISKSLPPQDNASSFLPNSKIGGKDVAKCIGAHEKYPSWPVTVAPPSSSSYRSHSYSGQTDYPKEKLVYNRPKKTNQFKISTSHLQPVLERTADYDSNKSSPESFSPTNRKNCAENYTVQYPSCSNTSESTSKKEFDFDAFFHTPCIPKCFEEKEYGIHSSSKHSTTSSSASGTHEEAVSRESNGFISRYEEVMRQHQAEYSVPLSSYTKEREVDDKGIHPGPDTPFLDRLRLESAFQMPPPPAPMIPAVAAPEQPQQDFELSSENGTWMGSMESSSHGRGIPKWQGSYSDLSTLSTQLSNRSSLFDSGHSTMPESGRLSPQSSCDSTAPSLPAPSLLLEGPTRAEVVSRHGPCHREIVAHSARVKQPERHGSESVLYYAIYTGTSGRINGDSKLGLKKVDGGSNDAMYRSHASVTLSPSMSKSKPNEVLDNQNMYKTNKCPSRQDSRKSSNSFSSEDSYPRSRSHCGDDTSGSSSDISNITCISNYKNANSKSLKEHSPAREIVKPSATEQLFPLKLQNGYEPSNSKSMDETTREFNSPDTDKRQRVSDPDLKTIQKQAVMSFYQRMSMVEAEHKFTETASEMEPPPPYEATPNTRMNKKLSLKLPLYKNPNQQWDSKNAKQISPENQPPISKAPNSTGLVNHHSKSVPNLMALRGQALDLPPSHPIFKKPFTGYSGPKINGHNSNQEAPKKRGSPLAIDEIISWDELPNVLEKKREAKKKEKAALSNESKDPPEDNGGCSSGMHYFKSHKSPRKVQLKEVHHSNETASVKVITPEGITLVQTHEKRRDDKLFGAAPLPPHKRRPAPPPPPKQPPKRPPPPPPPVTPPPQVVVVVSESENEIMENEMADLKIEVKDAISGQLQPSLSSPQLGSEGPPSPDLPLPPLPQTQGSEILAPVDEPLPPPPEASEVKVQPRILDSSSLIYPKNSYMSYRSERKLSRQGFDGKYRRSFHTSASSVDLTTLGSSFQDGKDGISPNSWEQKHNIRQHGTTIIFHSDRLQAESHLQRSNSQDCGLSEEPKSLETDNTSNKKSEERVSECDKSSNSINSQCSENHTQDIPIQSVPYSTASHEKNASETKSSSTESVDNNFTVVESYTPSSDNVVENCNIANVCDDSSSLDNILNDDSFVESEKNSFTIDHNQNAVKNTNESSDIRIMNGSDLNTIKNEAEITDSSKSGYKSVKTKEELECEKLSMDYLNRCGDTSLQNLLIPSPNHKTMSDYMEGLLNVDLESTGRPVERRIFVSSPPKNENSQRSKKQTNNEKGNTLTHYSKSTGTESSNYEELNDNECADGEREADLKEYKEELIMSIERKNDTLRNQQACMKEEMIENELLGQEISSRLQKVAKPNEMEKYSVHVAEIEKIINLLLSLSGRLARVENLLKNMPKENSEEKKILEGKREKLIQQHEDAQRLKESIDRRSNQVSTFLRRYFTADEYSDYDHFIKMKIKLIVEIREIDEKINLGEEQLAALSVVAHLWKSANS